MLRITITDHASKELRKQIATLESGQKQAMLRSIGSEVVQMGKKAFNDSSLRPQPWPALTEQTLRRRAAKGRKGTATLKDSGTLWRSIRVLATASGSVTVGTDRKYAAIHQFGGKVRIPGKTLYPKKAKALFWPGAKHPVKSVKLPPRTVTIPARPYMPMDSRGNLTTYGRERVLGIVHDRLKSIFG
jgi:phage virion morphogenesis protein